MIDPILTCPRDGTALEHHEVSGVEGDICPTCQGIWLPEESVARCVQGDLKAIAKLSRKRLEIECPTEAGVSLMEFVYNSVHIDICNGCGGLWLDGGELSRIRETRLGERDGGAGSAVEGASMVADGVCAVVDGADLLGEILSWIFSVFSS